MSVKRAGVSSKIDAQLSILLFVSCQFFLVYLIFGIPCSKLPCVAALTDGINSTARVHHGFETIHVELCA